MIKPGASKRAWTVMMPIAAASVFLAVVASLWLKQRELEKALLALSSRPRAGGASVAQAAQPFEAAPVPETGLPDEIEVPETLRQAMVDGRRLPLAIKEVFVLNERQQWLRAAGMALDSQEMLAIKAQRDFLVGRLLQSGFVSKFEIIEENGVPVGTRITYIEEGAASPPPQLPPRTRI